MVISEFFARSISCNCYPLILYCQVVLPYHTAIPRDTKTEEAAEVAHFSSFLLTAVPPRNRCMHALLPILLTATPTATPAMAAERDDDQESAPTPGEDRETDGVGDGGDEEASRQARRLQALEARAVAEATATADAAYVPSPSLLNATTAAPLLSQVDGPSLADYEGKESVYVGRSVPVSAGGTLTIPIQVSTPGSVVEYAVENKQYDFGFGITAEREEGVTIVKVRAVGRWGLGGRMPFGGGGGGVRFACLIGLVSRFCLLARLHARLERTASCGNVSLAGVTGPRQLF